MTISSGDKPSTVRVHDQSFARTRESSTISELKIQRSVLDSQNKAPANRQKQQCTELSMKKQSCISLFGLKYLILHNDYVK